MMELRNVLLLPVFSYRLAISFEYETISPLLMHAACVLKYSECSILPVSIETPY
jgi:hypothetical protein